MAEELGTGYISLLPSARGFVAALRYELKTALKNVSVDIPVRPEFNDAQVAAAARRANRVAAAAARSAGPVKLDVGFDARQLRAVGQRLGTAVQAMAAGSLKAAGLAAAAGTASVAVAGLASAAAGAIPLLIALGSALVQTSGVLVVVPGVLAVAGAAFAVLKIGTLGLGDAFKAVAEGDAKKLSEALKKLAPNARLLVREVKKVAPAFKALQLDVQNRLLLNTDKVFRSLATGTLPILRQRFAEIATVINRSVVGAVEKLNTTATRSTLSTVLAAAARTVGSLSAAFAPLGRAILDVLGVGALLTAELSTGIGDAVARLAERVSLMASSGWLETLFRNGLAAVGQFRDLVKDVIGVLGGLANAAGGVTPTGGIFGFFDRLNEAVNSAGGQQVLTSLFTELGKIGAALMPVLVALGQAFVPVAQGIGFLAAAFAPLLAEILPQVGLLVALLAPAIASLAPAVAAAASALSPLLTIIQLLVINAAPGLTAFIAGLAAGLEALAPLAPVVGKALGDLFTALAPVVQILGQALAGALAIVAPLLSQMAAVLAPILGVFADLAGTLVAALVPAMQLLATTLEPLQGQIGQQLAGAIGKLVPLFAQLAAVFAGQLAQFLPLFAANAATLLPLVVRLGAVLTQHFASALEQLMPHLPELISAVLQIVLAMQELFITILPIAIPLIAITSQLVLAALQAGLLEAVLGLLIGALVVAKGTVMFVTEVVRLFGKVVGDVLGSVGKFFDSLNSLPGKGGDAIKSLMATIGSSVGDAGKLLYDAGAKVVGGLIEGIKSMFGKLGSVAADMAGKIRAFLPFSPAKEGPLSGKGAPFNSGRIIAGDLAAGVESQLPTVASSAVALAAMFTATGATLGIAPPSAADDSEPVLEAHFDLGEGVTQVVTAKLTRHDRGLKRRVLAGAR